MYIATILLYCHEFFSLQATPQVKLVPEVVALSSPAVFSVYYGIDNNNDRVLQQSYLNRIQGQIIIEDVLRTLPVS